MCLPHVSWKNSRIILLLIVFFASFSVSAQSSGKAKVKIRQQQKHKSKPSIDWKEILGWSGSLRIDGFSKDNSFVDRQGYLASSLWLSLRPREFLGINTYLDMYVQGQNLNRDRYSVGDLREFYFDKSMNWLDLRVGRQIVSWGRADKVNPTDVWSLRNLNLLVVDDEEQKTGLFTTTLGLNYSNFKFIVLWQPEWRWPYFPITPLPDSVTIGNVIPEKIKNQFGLKLDYSGASVDASISYSHVIDKTPDLSIVSLDNGVQMGFQYSMIDVYGFDLAKPIGKFGFRTECAYVKTSDNSGADIFVKNNNVYCVVGVDRTFDSIYLNLQYIYKHVFTYQDTDLIADANQQYIAIQENIISNQLSKDVRGASFRIAHRAFNDKMESDITVLGWFKYSDYIIRPKINYSVTDNFRFVIGGEVYSGPTSSYFGRFKSLSRSFIEFKYLF